MAAQLFRLEPHREAKERLAQAIGAKDVDGAVAALRQQGHHAEAEDVRGWLERDWGQPACRLASGRSKPTGDACSFCDATRDDVAHLFSVRTVAICDRCADDASADMLGVLLPPP